MTKLLKFILVIVIGVGIVVAINFFSTDTVVKPNPTQDARYSELDDQIVREWSGAKGWDTMLNKSWVIKLADEKFGQHITTSQHDSLKVKLRLAAFHALSPRLDSLMKAREWNEEDIAYQFQGIDTVKEVGSLGADIRRFKDIQGLYVTCGDMKRNLDANGTASQFFSRNAAYSGPSWVSFDDAVSKIRNSVNAIKNNKYYGDYMDNKFTSLFDSGLDRLPGFRDGYYSILVREIKDYYPVPENDYAKTYADMRRRAENAASDNSRQTIEQQMLSLKKESDREKQRFESDRMNLGRILDRLGKEHSSSASTLRRYVVEYNRQGDTFIK